MYRIFFYYSCYTYLLFSGKCSLETNIAVDPTHDDNINSLNSIYEKRVFI